MNLYVVFALIVSLRLLSVFLVQTYYVPDEYWQSLEIAHRLVFGYGHVTWEWLEGLRSYIYPLCFAGIYKILALLQLDKAELLVLLPRVAQALLTAYADYRFFVWTGRKKWALFLTLISWFWFYIGSRTLVNTLETSLTSIALSYFPWYHESCKYLWIVALLCYLRPTAAIIWIPLCIHHLRKSREAPMQLVLKRYFPIGILVGAACIGIDSYFYGRWVFTPYEFLKHNVYNNIGGFYGTHPWYWYFSVGLPTVLGINTLPFIWGVTETLRNPTVHHVRAELLVTIGFALLALSTQAHKEFRFVALLLPLCLYISADTLTRWSYKASRIWLWIIAIVLVVGNAYPAWYLSTVHQKGPIELMPKLREIARTYRDETRLASILFLMPCHSTPYYSHLHENVTMRFLTCEPNLRNVQNYVDEADQFYQSPVHWIRSHIPSYPRHAMPSHVVLFDSLTNNITEFLLSYKEVLRIAHADYVNERTGKEILVFQRLLPHEPINVYNRDTKPEDIKPIKPQKGLYPDLDALEEAENDAANNLYN